MLKVLLTNAGTLTLAIILGVGWMWMVVFKDMGIIDDELRCKLLIILTAIFVVQQIGLLQRRFGKKREVIRDQLPVIEFYLSGMLSEYYTRLQSLVGDAEGPMAPIRTNVMLPTLGLVGTCLKIYYTACPPSSNIAYSNAEMQLEWKLRQGACGWAWEYCRACVYDSENAYLSLPQDTLNAAQKRLVRYQRSVLSLPITYDKEVVGVLNLDSQENVTKTHFNHPSIYGLALKCASELGVHCRTN